MTPIASYRPHPLTPSPSPAKGRGERRESLRDSNGME